MAMPFGAESAELIVGLPPFGAHSGVAVGQKLWTVYDAVSREAAGKAGTKSTKKVAVPAAVATAGGGRRGAEEVAT